MGTIHAPTHDLSSPSHARRAQCVPLSSETIVRGAGCLSWARPELREPRVGNCPRPPGPPKKRAALGGLTTMRAATRVNTEQASKLTMRKPTRHQYGEGCHRSGSERHTNRAGEPRFRRGNGGGTHGRGGWTQHGKPRRWRGTRQPTTREGWVGPFGVAERPVVPVKPGNAGGGKGPWFESSVRTGGKGHGDWREPIRPGKGPETPDGYMRKRRDLHSSGSTR